MKCPQCGLFSPDTVQQCDCGYNFHTRRMERPFPESSGSSPGRMSAASASPLHWFLITLEGLLITLSAASLFFGGWLCTGGARSDLNGLAIGATALAAGVVLLSGVVEQTTA